jgi:hypothetical protein
VSDETVEIKGVWLRREGDYVVVETWMPDGSYREVVREHIDGNFSHCVHAGGIKAAPVTRPATEAP